MTTTQAENSEVLPAGSVAVAVTYPPGSTATATVTVKAAMPEASVVTVREARNCSPCPEPGGSQTVLVNSSATKGRVASGREGSRDRSEALVGVGGLEDGGPVAVVVPIDQSDVRDTISGFEATGV